MIYKKGEVLFKKYSIFFFIFCNVWKRSGLINNNMGIRRHG